MKNRVIIIAVILVAMIFLVSCSSNNTDTSTTPPPAPISPAPSPTLNGNTFYVDPINGSEEGDGSSENPWSNLQEVINNKVETYRAKPGVAYNGDLVIKNDGAPIKAGDTIILKDGFYDELQIAHAFNIDYIRITSENEHQAVLSHFKALAASGWILNGVAINRELGKPDETSGSVPLVKIENSWHGPAQYITIEDCRLSTVWDSTGWNIDDWKQARTGVLSHGSYISVLNNHIKNIAYGITIAKGGHHSTVKSNIIENFSYDGMQGIADDLLFESNIVKNCYKTDPNSHDDGFQSWTDPPSTPTGDTSDRVTLRGNIIIEHEDRNHPLKGQLQGIGLFDGPYHDWVIENNVIITSDYHGITMVGGKNCRIVNNTVVGCLDGGTAHIRVADAKAHVKDRICKNVTVRNNITKKLDFKDSTGTITNDHNLVIVLDDYMNLFVDPVNNDFRLKAGSLGINGSPIDTGSSELAPTTDIEGNPRPKGSAYDIGAYEY